MTINDKRLYGYPASYVAGAAFVVLFFLAGLWWLAKPAYVAIGSLPESEKTRVMALLAEHGFAYRQTSEGGLEVSASVLPDVQRLMTDAGLPAHDTVGYELFNNADYGLSEFAQKINYQRALEGELARSIMALREIRHARVHLTLRKNSFYAAQKEPAKASVMLAVRKGMSLAPTQIAGIQEMVAASVEGLSAAAVVVVDESGQPLSSKQDLAQMDSQLQMSLRLEQLLQDKAESILDGMFGQGSSNIAVRVQLNFDKVRSIKELPVATGPDGATLVLKERQSQSADAGRADGGVEKAGREQRTDEVEYAVGKNLSETEFSQGRIERITVGVVVAHDEQQVVDTQALVSLLSAALGLSPERGDQVSITAVSRAQEVQGTQPAMAALPVVTGVDAPSTYPAVWTLAVAGLAIAIIAFLGGNWLGRRQVALTAVQRKRLATDVRDWLSSSAVSAQS